VLLSCVYSIAESRQNLSTGLELLRSRKGHSVVEFIYDAAKQGIPIDVIKKTAPYRVRGTLFVS
ncbi:hypothetical protein P9852_11695, partial [Geobacillus stearothermophilus]|nr:hypothetical protein [Geobacillus stearothermophilus]